MIQPVEIERALDAVGGAGLPICLHSSLRSFGWVADGADGIVKGFLAAGVTLLVPTFSAAAFAVPAPVGHQPLPFNCERDGSIPAQGGVPTGGCFDVSSTLIEGNMGAISGSLGSQGGQARQSSALVIHRGRAGRGGTRGYAKSRGRIRTPAIAGVARRRPIPRRH